MCVNLLLRSFLRSISTSSSTIPCETQENNENSREEEDREQDSAIHYLNYNRNDFKIININLHCNPGVSKDGTLLHNQLSMENCHEGRSFCHLQFSIVATVSLLSTVPLFHQTLLPSRSSRSRGLSQPSEQGID